jgi:hypothetical protein
MTRDKQLRHIDLDQVLEKRRLDQALNVKEFAVLAGISYSAARAWFRLPGFPAVRNVVFWEDFVQWRRAQVVHNDVGPSAEAATHSANLMDIRVDPTLPDRAARILAEAS